MNRNLKRLSMLILLLPLLVVQPVVAQMFDDILTWKQTLEDNGTAQKVIKMTASIAPGWHVYDQDMPEDGPNSLVFTFEKLVGARRIGAFTADRKPHEEYDQMFGMSLRWYEKQITFSQKIEVTDPAKFNALLLVEASVCNDQGCLPPTTKEFSFSSKDLKSMASVKPTAEEEAQRDDANAEETAVDSTSITQDDATSLLASGGDNSEQLWAPQINVLKAYGDETIKQANASLIWVFIYGFIGGLIALVTPCVWPMIPMTVSFFLKRNKKRKDAIKDATIYGLAIIIIYVVLGLAITLIFGASALNDLATNAFFNLLFFAILVFFAISFFGAFDLVLPAKWTNKLDSKADKTTGMLSIFFMAFTLVLVSFSCTGPIIGTLLVQTVTEKSILAPAIGMLGFSLALAIPFALFAIFPNFLQSMPKSGGWLNSVKVVMAFLELALSLKFLSVADLAYGWGILDRETFVALWVVIFALLGVYLLGKIQFPHDSKLEKIGVFRFFLSMISFAFAVYLLPGLWGAPLKAVSAFSPPLTTQDFNLYDGGVHAKFDSYEEGMRYAKEVNKPVLIDFSGFGCVNCREMENSVWIDPKVKDMLEKDYVLITLMVDDKTKLPEIIEVKEQVGDEVRNIKLRTVGDKWSYLQRSKFGANAQPFYVPLDANGVPLGSSKQKCSLSEYTKFLREGLKEFKERQHNNKPIPTHQETSIAPATTN